MLPNRQTCEYYIQLFKEGANLPQSARTGLINLFLTLLTMVPPTVQLIQGNISNPTPGSSFPHLVVFNGALSANDEACEWQQYKSRMTHITVKLRDAQGQPVLGSTLQPGGLVLQLTLLNATTMQPLSDADNPRHGEGLFLGKGGQQFETTVRLTESSHTFEFKVMLMSSDIGGALVKIKVAPPNADAGHPLCVITRAFRSRARSNVHEVGNKRPRSLLKNSDVDTNLNLNDVSTDTSHGLPAAPTGGGDGVGGCGDETPQFEEAGIPLNEMPYAAENLQVPPGGQSSMYEADQQLQIAEQMAEPGAHAAFDAGFGGGAIQVMAAADDDELDALAEALADDTNHGLQTDSNLGLSVDLNLNDVSHFASGLNTYIALHDDDVDDDDDDVDDDDDDDDDLDGDTDLYFNANELDEFLAARSSSSSSRAASSSSPPSSSCSAPPAKKAKTSRSG